MSKPFAAATLALLCVAPASVRAGVIRGTLHVPASAATIAEVPNAYPGRADALPEPHKMEHGIVTDAVIYVDPIPASVESTLAQMPSQTPKLAQKDQCFMPRVVAIAAGSSVDFPNMDPIYHNVFSLSPTRRFDLGKYPKGNSRRVDFKKPGLVNVYCEIHSNMEAFILVLPNHAYTRPTATGDYALPDLPPGTYQLHVWHPDLGTQTTTIVVPATGDVLQSVNY
jgi:plastocyanin